MLRRFEVENFKGFKKKLVLDFSAGEYDFNTDVVKDGIVNKAIVYGKNGSGKSCLGIALFDIIHHLTDKNRMKARYLSNYKNLRGINESVKFLYEFIFDGIKVIYEYEKADADTLLNESLSISDEVVLNYSFLDRKNNYVSPQISGSLNLDMLNESDISVVRYIYKNSPSNAIPAISMLMDFCDRMLWFRSLSEGNSYAGYMIGRKSLAKIIYETDSLADFENFLGEFGLNYNLDFKKSGDDILLVVKFGNRTVPFDEIASTGTMSLMLFYTWSKSFDKISFLFIDEFDAFFHYEAAATIVKRLNKSKSFQSVLTSHNTYLMQNKLTRPDCCFIINDNSIKSLNHCTDKEIREAHNLEKMYINGAFVDE